MRVLITGAGGQLGRELQQVLTQDTLFPFTHAQLDVTSAEATLKAFEECKPEVAIHCAAYTDTAGCEANPDLAYRVNGLGTRNVCLACQRQESSLLYISTNEVFDGAGDSPYLEFDPPGPRNIYGKSKLAGEQYVQVLLHRFWIVRTAWLYAKGGNNFISKILRAAEERGQLEVVTDEVSSATWARDLAQALGRLIRHPLYGIYHLTNEGSCSRYQWAHKILELAGKSHVPVLPTTTDKLSLPYVKSPFSEIRNFVAATGPGIKLRPWEEALREYFACL